MATPAPNSFQPQAELTAYLFARREAILNQWQQACETDPALSKVSALSREEFNNLLILILDSLEERILQRPPTSTTTAQAHTLMETLQELNYLARTLYHELNLFGQRITHPDSAYLLDGQQLIVQLMQETINGNVQKYDERQRVQATNLSQALRTDPAQIQELTQQRGDMLRQSAHDFQSSVGLINSAAAVLRTEQLGDDERQQFTEILERNLSRVQGLLTSLINLSRLESDQEPRQLDSLQANVLLAYQYANSR